MSVLKQSIRNMMVKQITQRFKTLNALLEQAIDRGDSESQIDELLDSYPPELRQLFRLGQSYQRARELNVITKHSAWRREKAA